MKLILASRSPRRRELLGMLGLDIEIFVPDTEEDCDRSVLTPDELVMGLACRKARAAAEQLEALGRAPEDAVILSADTVVVLDGNILEKPADADDARRMLRALSGRRHEVYTGIAAIHNRRLAVDVQNTGVYFRTLTDEMIDAYVASGDPMDKAGSYGIQSCGALFVERLEGDYFNVVGLPLVRTDEMLYSAFGIRLAAESGEAQT
ncbi:MAG: septum formation inhibitor Maf [Clostridia bacterium]|nr:septum formation inhibitor Maf [Clostridia bacterium]